MTTEYLCSFERGSASAGERRAAEWIAAELDRTGCPAEVEVGRAVGGYWGPLALLTGLGALAGHLGVRGWRKTGGVLGVAAAAGVWDDVGHARRWFRRLFLRHRDTWNVTATTGDPDAERTVVFVAHHDAAHSGLIFHPAIMPFTAKYFPKSFERQKTSLPVMLPVFLGPLLAGVGALLGRRGLTKLGVRLCIGLQAVWADVASRDVVPGANDNVAGVSALLEVAMMLKDRPIPGVKVILVSTGSEESNSEGMFCWARRHLPLLDRTTTTFVILESVGSESLLLLEGEGMLKMREYPKDAIKLLNEVADEQGTYIFPGLRFRNATDGIIALRAGYSVAMLGSCNQYKLPDNYHWPTDLPENIIYESVVDAARLSYGYVAALASANTWPLQPTPVAAEWRALEA